MEDNYEEPTPEPTAAAPQPEATQQLWLTTYFADRELDAWEQLDVQTIKKSDIFDLSDQSIIKMKTSGGLFSPSRITHSYTTPLYKDLPFIPTRDEKNQVAVLTRKTPLAQLSNLLQIPMQLLKPRKRIDVKEALGGHHREKHPFLCRTPHEEISNRVYDYYENQVQRKRVALVRKDDDSSEDTPPELDTGRPPKRRKACDERPGVNQRYAMLYNQELVEFVTGLPLSGDTEQRAGAVTATASRSLKKGADKSSLEASFVQGTWWTAEEKEKFFVFLGRRSRHDMAGIAEAIGTKTILECEVYHNVLFKEAQKLRVSYQDKDTGLEEAFSTVNCNVPDEAVTMEEIPSAAEMSEAWIEIEDTLAQGILDWESHLESACEVHNPDEKSQSRPVLYNPQVEIVGARIKPKPFVSGNVVSRENTSLGETQDYFEPEPLPFENEHLDDPINSLIRSSVLMDLAHTFRTLPLYDTYSKECVTVPFVEYLEEDLIEDLNQTVVDHTRGIIRYLFNRLSNIIARSSAFSTGFEVTKPMMLSILQEIQYSIPKHTLVDSIIARENIRVLNNVYPTSFRAKYYNPFETTWNSNILLSRRDYHGAYKLLREPIHNSTQKPLETNNTDTLQSVVDIETDGSDEEQDAHRNSAGKPAEDGSFLDRDEDREYLSDELLDYSAHAIGSRLRKKVMARAVPPPRHVDDFTEDDIRDMIEAARALDQKKVSHTALLEQTLLAQDVGRLPKEIDSDSEAFVSSDSGSEWESDGEKTVSDACSQTGFKTSKVFSQEQVYDYYKGIGNESEGLPDTIDTHRDGSKVRIGIKATAMLAYEECVLNDYDMAESTEAEAWLVQSFGNQDGIEPVYQKLIDWYKQDQDLVSEMLRLGGDNPTPADTGSDYVNSDLEEDDVSLDTPKTSLPLGNPFLHGIDPSLLLRVRLFVANMFLADPLHRFRFVQACQQKIAQNTRSGLAELRRRQVAEQMVKEFGDATDGGVSATEKKESEEPEDLEVLVGSQVSTGARDSAITGSLQNSYLRTLLRRQLQTFPEQGDLGLVYETDTDLETE